MNDDLCGRWRCPLSGAIVFAAVQDFSNGCGLGDESDDLHLSPALATG